MASASRTSGRSSTMASCNPWFKRFFHWNMRKRHLNSVAVDMSEARSSYPSDRSHRRAFVNSYRRFKTPVYIIRRDSVIQRLTNSSVLQLSYRQKTANPALRRCSHDLLHSQKEPACRGCDPTPTLATSELALARGHCFFCARFLSDGLTLANTHLPKRRVLALAPESWKLFLAQLQAW